MVLLISLLHGGLWDVMISLFVGDFVFALVFVALVAFIIHVFVKREQTKQKTHE